MFSTTLGQLINITDLEIQAGWGYQKAACTANFIKSKLTKITRLPGHRGGGQNENFGMLINACKWETSMPMPEESAPVLLIHSADHATSEFHHEPTLKLDSNWVEQIFEAHHYLIRVFLVGTYIFWKRWNVGIPNPCTFLATLVALDFTLVSK